MTDEERDGWTEAIEADERERHAVALAIQAEMEAAERTRQRIARATYRCGVEGCASDPATPWAACDNCLHVWRLEAKLDELTAALERLEADDSLTMRAPRADRYYSREIDAALWRRIEARTLRDQMARVQRLMRQRFDLTDAGRAVLREAEAEGALTGPTLSPSAIVDDALDVLLRMTRVNTAIVRGELSPHRTPSASP